MDDNIIFVPENDTYFTITRRFEAPRQLIYQCYTEPRHMAHFWGPRDTTLAVCEVDLRPGGVWRVAWRYPSGQQYGYASVYLEIVQAERLHFRDAPGDWVFGLDGLPPAQLVTTIALSGDEGTTTVVVTVRCPTRAERDENVRKGFTGMVSVGNDRLAEYLKTLHFQNA